MYVTSGTETTTHLPQMDLRYSTALETLLVVEQRSLAYLEKIVSTTGTAYSGVTGGSYSTYEAYVGCIATFKAPASASKLAFTAGAGQLVAAGIVSSVITVQVQDSSGNPVTSGATVGLSTSSAGGTFYSDAAGNNQVTSITISSGQSAGSFYYKDTTVGMPTLTASSTGLTSAATQFSVSQWTAGVVTGVSGGVKISSSNALVLDSSYSPTFAGSTLTGNTPTLYLPSNIW